MKGIVFTELLDLIEEKFGQDILEDVLDECKLESGGAYTSVGTYDHKELLEIVTVLSRYTAVPVKDLVRKYGHHLFFRFRKLMPEFFEKPTNAFQFLETVHGTIHVEVKKLYPDAKLPSFETSRESDTELVMTYISSCPFADFAHGLMQGCFDYYNEDIRIEKEDKNNEQQFCRVFTLTKR
ncbi:MAG: heme NO-binding domain-containing protein [Rhodospirillales bacterium]|nr:heme NO-binding domain-containing protein [Rhodospirillales bacterium]